MRATKTLSVVLVAILYCMTSFADACPWCDGGPSGINQVQAEIFGEGFWMRAAAVLAPFSILGGIVAFIYFGPTKSGRRSRGIKDGGRFEHQP